MAPNPSAPGSSEASPEASSTSEAFEFVGDTGPGFDPEHAAAHAEELRAEHEADAREADLGAFEIPDVSEDQIRSFLFNGGDGLHAVVGVGENDWRATQRDLDRIAPPLTRIVNRYEAARAVAGRSDELAVAVGMGLWSWRSILERQAVLEARAREHPGPIPTAAPAAAPAASSQGNPAPGFGVADGYVTQAERMRQARERTPDGQPHQDQPAP